MERIGFAALPDGRNGMKINFTCVHCSDHRIEEIMCDVTTATPITDIFDNGEAEYDLSKQSVDGGVVDRFQCMGCGYIIENVKGDGTAPVTEYSALFTWLRNNGWLTDCDCGKEGCSGEHPPQPGDSCAICPGVLYQSTALPTFVFCDQCGWRPDRSG